MSSLSSSTGASSAWAWLVRWLAYTETLDTKTYLVASMASADRLDAATEELLERVTLGSATSKGIGKQALYAQIDLDQPKAYAYAIEVMAATSQLPDAREGMHAFLEKRKPQWSRERP